MKPFHFKRLAKLADFLDTLPKAKFDYSNIVYQGGKPMLKALDAGELKCGTTACAMGWMPAVFPRDICWLDIGSHPITGKKEDERHPQYIALRDNKQITGFAMAAEYFGLHSFEAAYLFDPSDAHLSPRATPKTVAKHIRKFIRNKQKELAKRNNAPVS